MRRRIGRLLIIFGVTALAISFSRAAANAIDGRRARNAAQTALNAVQAALQSAAPAAPVGAGAAEDAPAADGDAPQADPDVGLEIDGAQYLGYLSIPALELELPIYAAWDDLRVQDAPCRYSGSIAGGALLIGAHNYDRHFGRISTLAEGDAVIITDAHGAQHAYAVAAMEILQPEEIDRMQGGDWALTLFTCTYGGQSRATIRCTRDAAA